MTSIDEAKKLLSEMLRKEVLERKERPLAFRLARIHHFVELGADINVRKYGKSLLVQAIENGEPEIIEAVKKNGGKEWIISKEEAERLGFELMNGVMKNDGEKVKFLIEEGAWVNVKDNELWFPLLIACSKGFVDVTKLLVENGAEINEMSGDKMSPLQAASCGGYADVVNELLLKGADIEARTKNGETALMKACEKGNLRVIKLLVENGADVNKKDDFGNTALMKVIGKEFGEDLVTFLVKNGADVNLQNNDGQTALMKAVFCGDKKVTEILLKNGADVMIKDDRGETVKDKMKFFYESDRVKIWQMLENSEVNKVKESITDKNLECKNKMNYFIKVKGCRCA